MSNKVHTIDKNDIFIEDTEQAIIDELDKTDLQ